MSLRFSYTDRFRKLLLLDVEFLENSVGSILSHDVVFVLLVDQLLDLFDSSVLLAQSILGLLVSAN